MELVATSLLPFLNNIMPPSVAQTCSKLNLMNFAYLLVLVVGQRKKLYGEVGVPAV